MTGADPITVLVYGGMALAALWGVAVMVRRVVRFLAWSWRSAPKVAELAGREDTPRYRLAAFAAVMWDSASRPDFWTDRWSVIGGLIGLALELFVALPIKASLFAAILPLWAVTRVGLRSIDRDVERYRQWLIEAERPPWMAAAIDDLKRARQRRSVLGLGVEERPEAVCRRCGRTIAGTATHCPACGFRQRS